jgi:protein O-mannosyl-transferase
MVLAVVAFGAAGRAPFDFDDLPGIVNNPTIRRLWPLSQVLATPNLETAVSGRPIANLSFALNAAINRSFGMEALGSGSSWVTVSYHAVNILIHTCAAILLFLTVRATVARGRVPESWRSVADPLAAAVAAIWLVHPIQTEAVDYIVQRTELLAACFVLATIYAGGRSWEADQHKQPSVKRGWTVAAVLASALGVLSKETAVIALPLLVLYDRAFLFETWGDAVKRRVWLYVALLATWAFPLGSLVIGTRTRTAGLSTGISPLHYAAVQGWAIPHYLWLVFWPVTLIHDYGSAAAAPWSSVLGALAMLLLIGTAMAVWRYDRWRWLGFLALGFFVALAPTSSILPIATEVAAERRVYLALAFVVIALVVAAEALRRRAKVSPAQRRVVRGLATGFCVVLVATAARRSAEYESPEILWRQSASFNPHNGRAVEQLAHAVIQKDSTRVSETDSLLERATMIDPSSPAAWVGRAVIALHRARFADAESSLVRALAVAPGDSAAMDKLAAVYVATRRPDKALPLLRQMAAKFANAKAAEDLGIAYLNAGQLDSAAALLAVAVRLDSTRTSSLSFLGAALVESNRGGEAIPYLTRSAALDSQPAFALSLLSIADAEAGHRNAALDAARQAAAQGGQDPEVLMLAGRGLLAAGDAQGASRLLERALVITPDDPEAMTRLAMAEAALANDRRAHALLAHVLEIAPNYGLAQQFLARLGAMKP